MSLLVVAIGVVLLSIPALTARSVLAPPARVRLACTAVVCGMWTLGAGALLTASPLLMWWHDGSDPSGAGWTHLSPGGPLAWTAGGLLAGLGACWVFSVLRAATAARRRAALPRWAADTVAHDENAGAEVRVAPTLQPIAFAVPGRDRHIVISLAVTRLPEPERRAVVAHEGAHLRLRHDRHLLILATYERIWGWLPGAQNVVTSHRRTIEQWADLDAIRVRFVDQSAVLRARTALTHHADSPPPCEPSDWSDRSSLRDLVGVTGIVAGLMLAGVYSATHTVGDLGAALVALH